MNNEITHKTVLIIFKRFLSESSQSITYFKKELNRLEYEIDGIKVLNGIIVINEF